MSTKAIKELVIAVKGAGEMATGVAWRLFQANCRRLFMLEISAPMAVRRQVSFCEAVYDQEVEVEGVKARKGNDVKAISGIWEQYSIPVLVDPEWKCIRELKPDVVIDAILAKKNLGTSLAEAPLVIGLGPGFEAGKDVHAVIETNRGHNLGRVILKGSPEPNTGTPGNIGGYTKERVLRAPCSGIFRARLDIGDQVYKGDILGYVEDMPVLAQIDGVVRGRIRDDTRVEAGLKIGDIDPRGEKNYCATISEKARAIGGSVLQAILSKYNQ